MSIKEKNKINLEVKPGSELEDVVNELLEYEKLGIHACCKFNNILLDSVTVTMDSAFLAVCGKSKKDFEEEQFAEAQAAQIRIKEYQKRQEQYRTMVDESRTKNSNKISLEKVLAGLKFIIQNPDMEHINLVQGLIDLGCNFTFKDIARYVRKLNNINLSKEECKALKNIILGATYVANVRDSEYKLDEVIDFFPVDYESAGIYNFIKLAIDEENTKNINKIQNL